MTDREYGRPSRVIVEWDDVDMDAETPPTEAPPAEPKTPTQVGKSPAPSFLDNLRKVIKRQDR